jgi:hypothetical protein
MISGGEFRMQHVPSLVGVNGYFNGHVFPLEYGKTFTIGRSRRADFSLRRTHQYRAKNQDDRDKDAAPKTVSGLHFQITMYNLGSIEIKNLSRNGTLVDGKSVATTLIKDVARKSHEIRCGMDEVFRLEMRANDGYVPPGNEQQAQEK